MAASRAGLDRRRHGANRGRCLAHQFIDDGNPPREWAERLYKIRRWTPMPRGGHFPSVEEPELLGRDIAAFFDELGAASLHPSGH